MKYLILTLLAAVRLTAYAQTSYKEDFIYFWETVNDNYCYFEKKQVDWNKVKEIYSPQVDTASSRTSFVSILENCIYELYDHHSSLRTRNKYSRRLVPTGTDMWAEFINGSAIITEVRKGSGTEKVGMKAGMKIIAINDVEIEKAIKPFLSHTVNNESRNFALRLALAGDHVNTRKITVQYPGNTPKDYYPDKDGMWLEDIRYPSRVEAGSYGDFGYIKINNFLYDNSLIQDFDSVLDKMMSSKAIIIDLRETPSGGNTTVARAILGRFISKDEYYQKHELYAEEKQTGVKRSWAEIVSPRKEQYKGKVVVIADHWTGSVGEGITIAFHGMKRATIIGTPLARLNGAIESFEMPNSKIGFNIAFERLYHVNGIPREEFIPDIIVKLDEQAPGKDVILETAIGFLKKAAK